MKSKTPQFDALLAPILENLKPEERTCSWQDKSIYCEKNFFTTDEDIRFLRMLRVPPPTLCPNCRQLRRLTFSHNMRFYKRDCEAPDHGEKIISFVPPKKPFKVYDWDFYRTYKWEPLKYAREYDFKTPFWEFFYQMRKDVPQYSLVRDPSSINSEYSLNVRNLKNGYFISGGWNSENVSYGRVVIKSSNCLDVLNGTRCQYCYEVVSSYDCYQCDFIYFARECIDSRFLYDCRNVKNSFGCVNLRSKEYCFFNEQLSKEEYEKRISEINLGDREVLKEYREKFWQFVKDQPIRAVRIDKSENVSGVDIINCKNCQHVVIAENSENIRYAYRTIGNKDSMDYGVSGGSELLYETVAVGSQCSNVKFSFLSKFITDSEFIINSRHISNSFGCIGMENKQFCIFNKQYSEEEYWPMLDKIKTHLLEKGMYGEFFPFDFTTFAYNGSAAQVIYPMNKEQIEKLGALYQEDIDTETKGLIKVEIKDLERDVKDIKDDILKKAIISEEEKPFRLIPSELEFYRHKKLAIPTKDPYQRINDLAQINKVRAFKDKCEKCDKEIDSAYPSSEGYKPYCQICYQELVV